MWLILSEKNLDWRDTNPSLGSYRSKAELSALGTLLSLKKLSEPGVATYAISYIHL